MRLPHVSGGRKPSCSGPGHFLQVQKELVLGVQVGAGSCSVPFVL